MADDDSRSEDAEKRPGKSSKPSKKGSKPSDGKAKAGKKDDKKTEKSDKAGKSEKSGKDDKSAKAEKSDKDKAVKTVSKSDAKDDSPKKRPNILRRFGIFIREIFEQLRKVVYPTRKQLLTYTAVVLIFVTIMIGVIYGLDFVMAEGVQWVFGGGSDK